MRAPILWAVLIASLAATSLARSAATPLPLSAAPKKASVPRVLVHRDAHKANHLMSELGLSSNYRMALEPLTTEKAWDLDPKELNPHRARWLVHRKVELLDLQPVLLEGKQKIEAGYGVISSGIKAETTLYVRGPGNWYQLFSQFNCQPEPQPGFSTREGSIEAGKTAAELWQELLAEEKLKLSLALDRIVAQRAEDAVEQGQVLFRIWLEGLHLEWQAKDLRQARLNEWRYYLTQAHQDPVVSQICKNRLSHKIAPVPFDWSNALEPPPSEPQTKLLARAPARRWSGLFSVRISALFGDKTLNGQFLVDSGAAASTLSPDWLLSQGINPALVEIPDGRVQRVAWSGGSGLAKRAQAFQVSLAGYPLPLNEFLLMKSDLFEPPNYPANCCDGILGVDFLRKFAVQLTPQPPFELQLYERKDFNPGQTWKSAEVFITPHGELESQSCKLEAGGKEIIGARWDTGSEFPIEVHLPWISQARSVKNSRSSDWNLSCGVNESSFNIGRSVPLHYPSATHEAENSPLNSKSPAFNVGIPLLGRGPFIFDLSHGRLWFHQQELATPILSNQTGLELDYGVDEEGDRELKISRIQPGSPAAKLAKSGLKRGLVITEIDAKPAREMDLWEVEQRLGGAFGNSVVLKWEQGDVEKLLPIKVREDKVILR